ncbi:MAG TPA: hypothetical protein VEA19_03395 [Actinomycetota bacterium]|nr:hypothetical protein [Actinomycetota bacterium]
MFWRLKEERGLAAMTVLLTTSVLAVAGSVVAYSSITELEIGARDRRAEDAFAAAEAGLDLAAARFVGNPTWASGTTQECLDNPLVPASAGITCEIKVTSPTNGQLFYPPTGRPRVEYNVLSSAKEGPSVTRNLVGQFRLEVADLPFGFFVDGDMDFGGDAKIFRESILVNGNVTSRERVDFNWVDAITGQTFGPNKAPDLGWRFHRHRIQSNPDPYLCAEVPNGTPTVGCAGVFANFQIYERNIIGVNREIHRNSTNPANQNPTTGFPNDRDVHQTRTDANGNGLPIVTLPTDAVLELMDTAKELAKQQGLYLNYKNGNAQTIQLLPSNLGIGANNTGRLFEKNVAVYIEADSSDTIGWKINLVPGNVNSSDIDYIDDAGTRKGSQSGLLVVRGGELHLEANTQWSGSIFVPENDFRLRGENTCTCTIYSKGGSSAGGTSTVQLTPEWFANIPAGFARVIRTGFLECEPFQDYPAGSACAGVT